jgi:hypothetical protein
MESKMYVTKQIKLSWMVMAMVAITILAVTKIYFVTLNANEAKYGVNTGFNLTANDFTYAVKDGVQSRTVKNGNGHTEMCVMYRGTKGKPTCEWVDPK